MTNIKADETLITTTSSSATNAASLVTTVNSGIDSFETQAESYIKEKKQSWIDNQEANPDSKYVEKKDTGRTTPSGSTVYKEEVDYAAIRRDANAKFDPLITEMKSTADEAKTKNEEVRGKLEKVSTALQGALTLISGFNTDETHLKVSFESISGVTGVSIGEATNINFDGTVGQIMYEIDGKQYTLSELLNAFYTYEGVNMNTVVQGAVLAEALGIDYSGADGEAMRKAMLESVKSLTDFAASSRLYGLATESDIAKVGAALGINTDVSNIAGLITDEDERNKYSSLLTDLINGQTVGKAGIAGSVLGAFGLASYLNQNSKTMKNSDKYKYETASELAAQATDAPATDPPGNDDGYVPGGGGGSPSGGGGGGGGGGGATPTPTPSPTTPSPSETITPSPTNPDATPTDPEATPTDPTATPTTPSDTTTAPGTTEPIASPSIPMDSPTETTDLPTETLVAEIEKDYDDLARQQYEAQGDEAIAAHRAEVIEEANKLFDAEDKTELINKLKEYGYSETDIATIIQDRELTISAMVSGDERAALAKIASELAASDGLQEFDTLYDNEQTLASLTDGTVTQLLATVTQDETVAAAYKAVTDAATTYTETTVRANAAIAAVTTAHEELIQVTQEIGVKIQTEPSQWDKTTLDAYNNEVNSLYESTKKTIGANIENWSEEDHSAYATAKLKATNNVAYNRGKDYSTWTSEDKNEYSKSVKSVEAEYIKKYGKDSSKWSSEVQEAYKKETDRIYRKKAIEVGKKNLTSSDNEEIAKLTEETKQKLIAKNGDYSKWTEEQKKEYDEKVNLLKTKYGAQSSTVNGEATWTEEQVQKYNEAVEKYNKAVEEAKNTMTEQAEAKNKYLEAKDGLTQAKEDFYNRVKEEQQNVEQPSETPPIQPENETQLTSGSDIQIGGVNVTEDGVTINNPAPSNDNTVNIQPPTGGNDVVDVQVPDNIPVGTGTNTPTAATPSISNEIVNDDDESYQDYGIPIVDAGQGS